MTETRSTLDEIACGHGADKGSDRHGFADIYERLLEARRDEALTLLEIGVFEGASLRMWQEYFTAARIFAIDHHEPYRDYAPAGTTVLIGNQTDTAFLDELVGIAGPLDVIVDDGGHRPEQQLTSLFHLWQYLRPGGIYAVEDVHTSYLGYWSPGYREPGTTIEVLKEVVDDVNWYWHQRQPTLPEVESVQFYPELVILTKNPETRKKRTGNPARNEKQQTPDPRYPGLSGAWSGRVELVEPAFRYSSPESASSRPSTASESK